ncbi:MAG: phosphate acyltransferase, partial [Bacteroidales bacterium]|nr:phosphate acyltransferase [Bacteroidales bacterium]
MDLQTLADLMKLIKDKPVKRLVLAAAQDSQALGAVLSAGKDRIVEPILIGDKNEIIAVAEKNKFDIKGLRIIDEPDLET